MKKNLHPTYFENAKIKCACGAEFVVGSTEEAISVEICSNCHPYYTGKEKLLDTAGRVDKFRERVEAAKKHSELKNSKTKESKNPSTSLKTNSDSEESKKKKPTKKLKVEDKAK